MHHRGPSDVTDLTSVVQDVSETHSATCLDVSECGTLVATGSEDHLVKVWGYESGACYRTGIAHSATVRAVAITPDAKHLVSVGDDGAILIWAVPPECDEAPTSAMMDGMMR